MRRRLVPFLVLVAATPGRVAVGPAHPEFRGAWPAGSSDSYTSGQG